MLKRPHLLAVVFLMFLGAGFASGQSLQSEIRQKLDPVFQALVASTAPQSALSKAGGVGAPAGFTKEGEPLYDAIITTTNADAVRSSGIHVNSVVGKFATAQVTRQDLLNLVQLNEVGYVDPGTVNHPMLDVSMPETGANLLHSGFVNNTPYKGKGVIVLIYDTGIDWRHLDFRDPVDTTKSRILAIWDQTLSPVSGENPPAKMSYGVEYTRQQIDAELGSSPPNFVREKDIEGHGTHVAGIAVGNGSTTAQKYVGMAPEADIVVVKGGNGSFSESRMIDGLTYAANISGQFNEPIAVNWSIGGHFGPHDGTRPYEATVNNFVQTAGRVVAISAGNEGAQIMHIGGTLNGGGSTSIAVTVPTYTPTSGTDNDTFELDVWFNSQEGVNATVTSPSNVSLSVNPNSGNTESPNNTDGTIDLIDQLNNYNQNRYVELYVHDRTANVPRSGNWTLTLSGAASTVTYDAWLSSSTVGNQSAVIQNGNSQKTVAMPGTAAGAITVGSYVTKNTWYASDGITYGYTNSPALGSISSFSSIGPTGDGRQKPEIAAPGQGISSALTGSVDVNSIGTSWIMPGYKYVLMQGTSMASPHVAGAAALLLQISPGLTASAIKSLLTSTAVSDASTLSVPNYSWGYGKMDVLSAAVKEINPQATVQKQTLAYDVDGINQIFGPPYLTGATKYAVRFTPTISGQLTGMQVNITTAPQRPIQGAGPLVCEIWTNVQGSVGGIPGTKLGNTVLQPFQRLSPGSNNIVDMTSANVMVSAGQDYHLVIAVTNPQDTIKVRTDDAPNPATSRSSYYFGNRWLNAVDQSSVITTPHNIRIRAMVTSLSGLVAVNPQSELPNKFELSQNFPNPFNPTTTIRYSIVAQGHVRLRVFDLIGREVASLVDEVETPGSYLINWRGTDKNGVPLASGVYFYKLESSGQQITKKMILLK